jgi:cell division protein FtsB
MIHLVGRKTRVEKLEVLKANLDKKTQQRAVIDMEIKTIKAEIEKIEQDLLLKETSKLKTTLSKMGLSFEDVAAAIESGEIQLRKPDGDAE